MIRKILLSTVALCAVSTAAFAADLPSRRAPPVYVPPPIPVFSWTGFYMGGQVGFAFGEDRTRVAVGAAAINAFDRPNGIIGGAHVGYNFSTQSLPLLSGFATGFGGGGLVLGVEGDIDGTDYRNTNGNGVLQTTIRSPVQGSARGRLGIAFDRALFYATGGAAFAQFQTSYTAPGFFSGTANSRVGYTVGGGVEYAITTQWSLRGEYRYSDFGSFNNVLAPGVNVRRRETIQRAQVGFSYKFDTAVAAPVVARY